MNPLYPNILVPQQKLNRTLSTESSLSNNSFDDDDDNKSPLRFPNFLKNRIYLKGNPFQYLERKNDDTFYDKVNYDHSYSNILCSSSCETDPLINGKRKEKWWNKTIITPKQKKTNKWRLSPLIAYEEEEKRRESKSKPYWKALSPYLFFFGASNFITMNVFDSYSKNPKWWNMYGRALNPMFGPGQATLMRFGMHSNAKWSILTNIFVLPHLPSIILFLMNIPYLVRLERKCITSWTDGVGFVLVTFICSSFAIFFGDGAGGAIYPLLVLSFNYSNVKENVIWILLWISIGLAPFFSVWIHVLAVFVGLVFGWFSRRENTTWENRMAIGTSIAFVMMCLYAWDSYGCKIGHVYINEMCVQSCFWKGEGNLCDYSCLEMQGKDVEIFSKSENCDSVDSL